MTVELQRVGSPIRARIILAHGAGAGKDSEFMQYFASRLAENSFECILFDFPYMQKRALDGKKRPPDRAPKLLECFREVITEVGKDKPLLIGGKSMGGRMASLLAAEQTDIAAGLILLGYPFHPPGKPEKLRTEHLGDIQMPTLLLQGERDTFGGKELLNQLTLPPTFETHLLTDGDHSFKPRKASGLTQEENWNSAVETISSLTL